MCPIDTVHWQMAADVAYRPYRLRLVFPGGRPIRAREYKCMHLANESRYPIGEWEMQWSTP